MADDTLRQSTRRDLVAAMDDANTPLEAMDATADFILHVLAEALDVANYQQCDGTETWDGDVAGTVYAILRAARVIDDKGEVAKTSRPPRTLTIEHLDKIEAFLAETLGRRSFPTFQGIEGWEWWALLAAARKGLEHEAGAAQ